MPRSLSFVFDNQPFDATLIKVDRSHLYGSVSVDTSDMDGKRCTVATLAIDGKTLIPKGGTALGYINTEGEWITRDKLQPVDLDGNAVDEVESSFDAPIVLTDTVATEQYLDHSVRLTYRLGTDEHLPQGFTAELGQGKIFHFGFSYRGGVGHDPAFILSDDEANIWLMITEQNLVQAVGLAQAGVVAGEEIEADDEDGGDAIDFGML